MKFDVKFLPNAFRPDLLVEPSVDADVGSAHLFDSKLSDLGDRARRPPLEADAVESLVKIDGEFASHHIVHRALLTLTLLLRHRAAEKRRN